MPHTKFHVPRHQIPRATYLQKKIGCGAAGLASQLDKARGDVPTWMFDGGEWNEARAEERGEYKDEYAPAVMARAARAEAIGDVLFEPQAGYCELYLGGRAKRPGSE